MTRLASATAVFAAPRALVSLLALLPVAPVPAGRRGRALDGPRPRAEGAGRGGARLCLPLQQRQRALRRLHAVAPGASARLLPRREGEADLPAAAGGSGRGAAGGARRAGPLRPGRRQAPRPRGSGAARRGKRRLGRARLHRAGSARRAPTSWPRGSWTRTARCSLRAARSCSSRPSILGFSPRPAACPIDLPALSPLLREVSWPSTQMLVEDAQMRFYDFGRAPRDWRFIERQLTTAREYAQKLAAGEDPWRDRTGLLVKAYRSEVDDTLQPYGLYVPKAYDPKKAWPLVVSLHGATSNHLLNRRRVFGLGQPARRVRLRGHPQRGRRLPRSGLHRAHALRPGRGGGLQRPRRSGTCCAPSRDVKRAYNVDEDRVYLTGLSMGGGGTWHLGLRYPDLFAAIAPVCAVGDVSLFAAFSRAFRAEAKALLDLTGPTAIAENASNQQVFIFHGDVDPVVVPEHSRRMAARYRELGLARQERLLLRAAGGAPLRLGLRLPRRLDLRAASLPSSATRGRSGWSTRPTRRATTRPIGCASTASTGDGSRRASRAPSGTAVSSSRPRTSRPSPSCSTPSSPRPGRWSRWTWTDGPPGRACPATTTLSLSRDRKGRWVEKAWTGPAVGPPDHAEANFLGGSLAQRDAHVYVYGTAGEPAAAEASKKAAQKLADWGPNVRARFAVVADTEVTAELMASRSLVLIGNAAVNQVVARLSRRGCPFARTPPAPSRARQRVAGPEGAFRLYHPNPLAPGRYVRVLGAGTAEALARLLPAPGRVPRSLPRPTTWCWTARASRCSRATSRTTGRSAAEARRLPRASRIRFSWPRILLSRPTPPPCGAAASSSATARWWR